MNTQRFISKTATFVVLASLATAVAPALALAASDSQGAMDNTSATGDKAMNSTAHDKAMANKGMMPADKSTTGSTTGSGMGGSGTTESNPSNTK
jgi:hypothetical protein